jgi:hypothetical protein
MFAFDIIRCVLFGDNLISQIVFFLERRIKLLYRLYSKYCFLYVILEKYKNVQQLDMNN